MSNAGREFDKGYQLIEPAGITDLYAKTRNFEFAVAVFSWLIQELRAELGEAIAHVRLDVICAEYVGAHPAIGAHYYERESENLGPLIEETIDRLLKERPVLSFASFVGSSNIDWKQATTILMTTKCGPP